MSEELEKIFEDLSLVDINKPPDHVMGQIYITTCKTTSMSYVGQTRSHKFKNNKWSKHGYLYRWNDHLSAAKVNTSGGCTYLNNAIRKYGKDDWNVILLLECKLDEVDEYEKFHIINQNTLSPNGYNLKGGGKSSNIISDDMRQRISQSNIQYWNNNGNKESYSKICTNTYDLAKIEKVRLQLDKIDNCKINTCNTNATILQHKIISVRFYDINNKSVHISNKRNEIRYGGKHITTDDSIQRIIHLFDSLDKQLTITILDEDLKTKYNSFEQDISIAGSSLTQSKD